MADQSIDSRKAKTVLNGRVVILTLVVVGLLLQSLSAEAGFFSELARKCGLAAIAKPSAPSKIRNEIQNRLLPGRAYIPEDLSYFRAELKRFEATITGTSLPHEYSAPLKRAFVKKLLQNAKIRKIQRQYRNGRNLRFFLHDSRLYGWHLPVRSKMDFYNRPYFLSGWDLQIRFTEKVIRAIFPEATVDIARENHRDLNADVNLGLEDAIIGSGEMPAGTLNMQILKAANPGGELPSREEIRKSLGLPENDRIVSLYAGTSAPGHIQEVIKTLFASGLVDKMILSFQKRDSPEEMAAIHTWCAENSITYQPGLTTSANPQQGRTIIENDTRGHMPAIHTAADFAVVIGPANIMEPLNAGRLTYFEKTPSFFAEKHNVGAWHESVRVAEETGGGHAFDKLEELPTLLAASLGKKFDHAVYDIPDSNGISPLDRFVTHLVDMITAQLAPY